MDFQKKIKAYIYIYIYIYIKTRLYNNSHDCRSSNKAYYNLKYLTSSC
jgi:hypothetical protein